MKRFVRDKSLTLIGSSWMVTQGDNQFLALILELEQDPMTCEMGKCRLSRRRAIIKYNYQRQYL